MYIIRISRFSVTSANFDRYFKTTQGLCSGQIFVDEDLTCTIIYNDIAPAIREIPIGRGRLIVNLVVDNTDAPTGTGLRASDMLINVAGGIGHIRIPHTNLITQFFGPGRTVNLNAGTS